MKLTKYILSGLFLVTVATMSGKTLKEEFAEDPRKAGEVYYLYTYEKPEMTPAPEGYKPFYINHYGRHGSRYLLTDEEYSGLKDAFDKAAAAGALTEKGKEVYEKVKAIYDEGIGRGGDLTALGAKQHKQIAARMIRNYPEVFQGDAKIDANATRVIRCILSMAAFCESLKEYNPDLRISRTAGERTTGYLNFHDRKTGRCVNNDFLEFQNNGDWLEIQKNLFKKYVKPARQMKMLFKNPNKLFTKAEQIDIVQGLYLYAVDQQNTESGIDMYDLFTIDELYGIYIPNMWYYYASRSAWPGNKGIPVNVGVTLLDDMLEKGDAAVKGGEYAADLRFGHDGNLLAYYTLMELPGFSPVLTDIEEIAEQWRFFNWMPMAGNFQWVYYRKPGSDDVLVKFLINEKETRLPIETDCYPYYHWSDVSKHYHELADKHRPVATPLYPK